MENDTALKAVFLSFIKHQFILSGCCSMKWILPSWCLNRWLHTALLFLSPLLIAALVHSWLTAVVMERRVIRDLDEIHHTFAKGLQAFERINIKSPFATLSFTCSEDNVSQLNSHLLSPVTVRFIQLELDNGVKCSNIGPALNYQIDQRRTLQDAEQSIMIATIIAADDRARSLIFIFPLGPHQLVVLTNGSVTNDLLSTLCHDCYQLQINYRGLKSLERGVDVLSQRRILIEKSYYDEVLDANFILRAGDKQYQKIGLTIAMFLLIMALLLSSIAVIFYWNWFSARVSTDTLIQNGLKRKEFVPYYQVVIDCRTGQVVGQEMLVRWRRLDGVLVHPNQFIPYAEDSGLILPITEHLLEQVYLDLPQLKGWVSVNIIAQHLEAGLLSKWLLSHQDVRVKRISFELTERKPITEFELALAEISAASPLCHGFKLDDFGTGFGGFSYLHQLGINSIKIDKMFIDTIGTEDLKGVVLDAIIAFGHESNMDMVAEGVETQVQVDYLAAKGVYLHQGYFYAEPLPLDKLIHFYNNSPH